MAVWFTLTLGFKIRVIGYCSQSQDENVLFSTMYAQYYVRYFLVVCQVICAIVVFLTSGENFLVSFYLLSVML